MFGVRSTTATKFTARTLINRSLTTSSTAILRCPSLYFRTSTFQLARLKRPSLISKRSLATLTTLPGINLNMTYPIPSQLPTDWASLDPLRITSIVTDSIATTTALLDSIAALQPEECNFDTVVRKLAHREAHESLESEPAIFLQYVSTDAAVRDAAVEGDKTLQDFGLTALTRTDIFAALLAAKKNTDLTRLNPEEKRLLDRMIRDRERTGLALGESDREELLKCKKRIMVLASDFQRNCNEEKGFLLFSLAELEGVPEDVISGFAKDGDDRFKVTFKTPDIIPLFKYAKLGATRKAAVLGYEGKTEKLNAPLLAEIITLRRQAAALLGKDNWAEHVLAVKMAKDATSVNAFLHDLRTKLTPLGIAEKEKLLLLKKEEHLERGIDFDGVLYLWDYRYYDRLYLEKNLALDEEAIKEFFPVATVVPAILGIYSKMLDVHFEKVPRTAERGGKTWHEDADMYAVYNASAGDASSSKEAKFLGYLNLDLFPRENKYGHAAVWGLIPGWEKPDGTRNFPTVSMVANLAKETRTKPALMKHGDVTTFFHEMGHAFHSLCSSTQYARFSGTAVARDFVEAPSQMLENWCYNESVLKEMGKHYETSESLSDETIKSIIASRSVNQGLFNLRQLFHASYDINIHTSPVDQDLTKLWCDSRQEISLVSNGGECVGGQSGFAHIVGGYEAGYYGYLYSQVFSADMFKTIFAIDPMSKVSGLKYRAEILQPGGSRDEMESLVAFLGREPTNDAFMESLLASSSAAASKL